MVWLLYLYPLSRVGIHIPTEQCVPCRGKAGPSSPSSGTDMKMDGKEAIGPLNILSSITGSLSREDNQFFWNHYISGQAQSRIPRVALEKQRKGEYLISMLGDLANRMAGKIWAGQKQ